MIINLRNAAKKIYEVVVVEAQVNSLTTIKLAYS